MSGPRPVEQQQSTAHSPGSSHRPHRAKLPPSLAAGLLFPSGAREVPAEARHAAPRFQLFVQTLIAHDDEAASRFVHALLGEGIGAQQLYESYFTPAARILGEMWCNDDCSFYDVTVGTGRIQRLVREVSHQFLGEPPFPGSTGRILLACASGEQHSLGVAILAEYFVRDGWDVQLSQGIGSEGLLDNVTGNEYNLLGFSVALTDHIGKLQMDIRRIRQVSRKRDIKVLVGGAVIIADPSLAKRMGADGYANDASSAVREARRLLLA